MRLHNLPNATWGACARRRPTCVSDGETASSLADGDEYVDLEHPDHGIRRAFGTSDANGVRAPKKSGARQDVARRGDPVGGTSGHERVGSIGMPLFALARRDTLGRRAHSLLNLADVRRFDRENVQARAGFDALERRLDGRQVRKMNSVAIAAAVLAIVAEAHVRTRTVLRSDVLNARAKIIDAPFAGDDERQNDASGDILYRDLRATHPKRALASRHRGRCRSGQGSGDRRSRLRFGRSTCDEEHGCEEVQRCANWVHVLRKGITRASGLGFGQAHES